MSYESVFKVLGEIVTVDGLSYGIVGALAAAAFVLMHVMLPSKGLAYVFLPGLFWGGLVGIYIAKMSGFVFSTERAVNGAAVATVGMVGALVGMVLLTRLADAVFRIRKPVTIAVPLDRRMQV